MPIINSIEELLTNEENASNASITTNAPAKAPDKVATYPYEAKPKEPPVSSITTATPRLEPVEIPNIEGSASGLPNKVCKSSPHTANAAPANADVTINGTRLSKMMKFHAEFSDGVPVRIPTTSPKGTSTEPIARSMNANTKIAATSEKETILNLPIPVINIPSVCNISTDNRATAQDETISHIP